jgi:hypothetical protein
METRVKDLIRRGDGLFSNRKSLVSLWQEMAEQFYPERADFTVNRSIGTDFAANLSTSYPLLARRELGNIFSSMLRPLGTQWLKVSVFRDDRVDNAGQRWLDRATEIQFRAMMDRKSYFDRACSQADHDYASFGQAVISVELNSTLDRLLYRNWHLRDVAWSEGPDGNIVEIHRKWKPTAKEVVERWPTRASAKMKELAEKPDDQKVECRHVVVLATRYEGSKKFRTPYVSVYIDVTHGEVLAEEGSFDTIYAIPRWQTVSGSQYAHSPAMIAALPEARMIQAMSLLLLEAGEKAVDPPMVAVEEALRSDVNLIAGGITFTEADYDERQGEAVRPLFRDKSGLPFGLEMLRESRQTISEAFFLNKLNLPPAGNGTMTAFEVGQRIQEYIRSAMPLFGPTLTEYNGQVCDLTFERLFRVGAFGSPDEIPESLRGQDIEFKFESPLHDAADRAKGQKFMEMRDMLAMAVEMDPSVAVNVDTDAAFRAVLRSLGTPAEWIVPEEVAAEARQMAAQKAEMESLSAGMAEAGGVMEQVGRGAQAMEGVI